MVKLTQKQRNNEFNFRLQMVHIRRAKKKAKKAHRSQARADQLAYWEAKYGQATP